MVPHLYGVMGDVLSQSQRTIFEPRALGLGLGLGLGSVKIVNLY